MKNVKVASWLVTMGLAAVPAAAETGPEREDAAARGETTDKSAMHIEEVLVTGTALHGVAPTGSHLTVLGQRMIQSSSAMSSSELLQQVPQMADFARTPAVRGRGGSNDVVNAPSLRGLPESGGSNPTLLLVDGHRVAPAGIRQVMADGDTLPPGVIERVEILADGGSALYGADAVAGVINYITRRRFDGADVHVRYGMADDYNALDAGFMVGKAGDASSVMFAYNQSRGDAIYGRDRDYIQRLDWTTGVPLDRTCNPGNVSVGGTNYALPDMIPGTVNACDFGEQETYFPRREQESFFAAVTHDLGERISLDLRGWYTERRSISDAGPLQGTVSMRPTNPFYRSTGDANGSGTQTVRFNMEPAFGSNTRQLAEMETWDVRASLNMELNHGWQMRTTLNYGRTENRVDNAKLNTTALSQAAAGTSIATAFNPYDPGASHPDVLASIRNWKEYGRGDHELMTVRAAFDGPLMSLPGGELRLAIGGEYIAEDFKVRVGDVPFGDEHLLPESQNDRDVKAAYVELNVPVVGPENRLPGIESLTLSLASRHDQYSDFGSTTNSKVGLDYEPISWVKLRAAWSESFQAPSLYATTTGSTELIARPFQVVLNPGVPLPAGPFYQLFLSGGNADLQPQQAESKSFGISVLPPAIPRLVMSLDYWEIEITEQVSTAPMFGADFFSQYGDAYMMFPSPAELAEFAALAPQGLDVLNGLAPNVPVYIAVDQRLLNLSESKVSGLDFSSSYTRDTRYGGLYASLNLAYLLETKSAPKSGMPYGENNARYGARTNAVASIGLRSGNLWTQLSAKYRSGFDVNSAAVLPLQSRVGEWYSVDLYARYDLPAKEGFLSGMSLSLNVDNLFDKEPSVYKGLYRQSQYGFANPIGHIGRQIQLGISKSF